MHEASQEDPAPDSLEYRNDVWCEHGLLTLNHLNRRRISTEVMCPSQASKISPNLLSDTLGSCSS